MRKKNISAQGLKAASRLLNDFFAARPEMAPLQKDFTHAVRMVRQCFQEGHTLFICGNGGSYADSLHIAAEFVKSFERKRPLPEAHRAALDEEDSLDRDLAQELESGLPAIALGANNALSSAIWNDKKKPLLHFAQELYVLGNRGDILLAISTSGNARNVQYAAHCARMMEIRVISLTGAGGGALAKRADLALRAPGERTFEAQELHLALYHLLCRAVEASFFPDLR